MSTIDTIANSRDLVAFEHRCRAFMAEHAASEPPSDRSDPTGEIAMAAARQFQRALSAAGLAGLTYPVEYGGQGLSKDHERIWRQVAAEFPLQTGRLAITHGMCLPMVAEFGTPEQKRAYLGKLISAEEVWCQMFSEPSAGSDVAALQSRAVRDGDEWVINGQKVWTTLAHVCERGIVIARTDPSRPKHRGISMFIVDMRAPGVEVRAIRQIDRRSRFNEVFFTDVRVPLDQMIPPENDGWRLATAMLMYERVAIGTGQQGGIQTDSADRLIALAATMDVSSDPVVRQALARLYTDEVCQSLVGLQTRSNVQAGRAPGPGGSLGKLARSNIAALVRELSMRLLGPNGVAWGTPDGEQWSLEMLGSLSAGIAGGTDEIQRNIIGERVLGLPREPAVDRDLAFSDLLTAQLRR
jgi:alkylation response protein AidB-like acyl-CoA dehydrogenase